MVQATTPTFVLNIPDTVDLTQAANVYFALKQGCVLIEKETDELTIEPHTVYVALSQAETLRLATGLARIQLNWTYEDGTRACTNIVTVNVLQNLMMEVLE